MGNLSVVDSKVRVLLTSACVRFLVQRAISLGSQALHPEFPKT